LNEAWRRRLKLIGSIHAGAAMWLILVQKRRIKGFRLLGLRERA
jgi:hypothetical protein